MKPGGSMPYSQVLSNNPYSESNQPNSSYCTHFFKVHSDTEVSKFTYRSPLCVVLSGMCIALSKCISYIIRYENSGNGHPCAWFPSELWIALSRYDVGGNCLHECIRSSWNSSTIAMRERERQTISPLLLC